MVQEIEVIERSRLDYLDMEAQAQALEESMRPGSPEYDALGKKLEQMGKEVVIGKTLYWHWLVEKEDFPERFFFHTPPIGKAPLSDRVLVTGTHAEVTNLMEMVNGLKGVATHVYITSELRRKNVKRRYAQNQMPTNPLDFAPSPSNYVYELLERESEGNPHFVYCSRVGSFWQAFFGVDEFLDKPEAITVPRSIIGTGAMRNYNAHGGETRDVKQRLERVANDWYLPIHFMESWAI